MHRGAILSSSHPIIPPGNTTAPANGIENSATVHAATPIVNIETAAMQTAAEPSVQTETGNLLAQAFAATDLGFAIFSFQGEVQYWSEPLARLTGVKSSAAMGRRVRDFFPGEFVDRVSEPFKQLITDREGKIQSRILRTPFPGAPVIRVDWRLLLDVEKRATGVLVVAEDVTVRQAAATELTGLRQALEQSKDMYFRVAADSRILDVNVVAEQTLGYTRAQLLAMHAADFDLRANEEMNFAERWKKFADAGFIRGESQYRCANGKIIQVEFSIHFLDGQAGGEGFCLVRDVSDRRRLELSAEATARQFRTYFSDSPLGIMVRDERFCVIRVNTAYVEMCGYSEAELVGTDIRKIIHPDDIGLVDIVHEKFASNTTPFGSELRIVAKDGRTVWIHGKVNLLVDEDGKRLVIATAENITDRKIAQQALEASLRARAAILETTLAGVVQIKNGMVELANHSFEQMFGYTRGALNDRHISELVTGKITYQPMANLADQSSSVAGVFQADLFGDDSCHVAQGANGGGTGRRPAHPHATGQYETIREHARAAFGRGEAFHAEMQLRRKDGEPIWVSLKARPIEFGDTESSVILTFHDITDRVTSERAVAESNRRVRVLIDTIPDIVWMKDVDGRYVAVNQTFMNRCGLDEPKILGHHDRELFSAYDAGRFGRSDAQVRSAGVPGVFEDMAQEEDGFHWREVTKAPVMDGDGNCVGVIGISRDVTDDRRQRTQMARLLSEHEILFELTAVGVGKLKHRLLLRANRKLEEIFGYETGEMVGLHTSVLYADPADYDRVGLALHEDHGVLLQIDLPMRRKNGDAVWCSVQINPIDAANPMAGYICTVADITPLRERERALKSVLAEQRVIFDNALVGITLMQDGKWLRVNDAFSRMFGYRVDECLGNSFAMLFSSDELFREFEASIDEELSRSGMSLQEWQLRRKDGRLACCLIQGRPIDLDDDSKGIIFTAIDISARKASEEKFVQVSTFLDAIVENLPTVVAVRDVKTRQYLSFNRAGEMMTGRNRNDVIGKTPDEIYPPDVTEELYSLDDQVIQSRHIIETATSAKSIVDGSVKLIVRKTVPVINQANEVQYVMSLAEDVTVRVRSEQALRESEARFRQFAANINQVIFLSNPERSSFDYLNDRVAEVLGVSIEEMRADPRASVVAINEADRPLLQTIRLREESLQPVDMEIRINHPLKGLRWLRLQTFPTKSDVGGIRVFGLIADITDRKDEEQLRISQLLEQRDVLVREVHHRIKNNLQGVAGLLQHASRNRPELKIHLDEVSTQIQAIAQVHGLQVRAGQALPLRGLAKAIFDNLSRVMPERVTFNVVGAAAGAGDLDVSGQYALPESEAVPVALVLNELGTNAVKHGSDGARVSMTWSAGNVVMFEFENIGALPVGFDYAKVNNHASGIGLIKALVPRRGGSVVYMQQGASVIVRLTLQAPAIVLQTGENNQ